MISFQLFVSLINDNFSLFFFIVENLYFVMFILDQYIICEQMNHVCVYVCVFRINSFIYDKEFGHQTCNTQTGRLEKMNEENILILPQVIIIIIYSQFI